MATTNSLGFGSLSSVSWTSMDGTDLTAGQLAAVNATISGNTAVANLLLAAVNGAVNVDWTSFSLSDLGGGSGVIAARAAQINARLGMNLNGDTVLSLGEWRRIAAELQNDAAREASKRNVSSGGGIKAVNGKWFVNGEEVSLLDVYMAVRVNQVANFDDSLELYMEELKANNKLVKAANQFLAVLRALKPSNTSQQVTGSSVLAAVVTSVDNAGLGLSASSPAAGSAFATFAPIAAKTLDEASEQSAGYNYLKFDTWIEEAKQFVSQKDTENQIAQQKLEQITNRRSEVLEGLTSFIKSQSQTGQSMSRNLG